MSTSPVKRIPDAQAMTPMDMLNKAVQSGATIEIIEKLVALQERMEARIAEREYDAAMADAQALMRPVAKDASNPQTRSRYSSYSALDDAVRPIYTDHGFSLSFNTGDSAPGELLILCRVAHRGGHSRMHQFPVPADGKGAKGGDVMTKTHAAGSAASYGQRYILKQVFNLASTDKRDDDDGNRAGGAGWTGELISEAELTNLQIMAEEVGANIPGLCAVLKVPDLPSLPKHRYDEAAQWLEKKARKNARLMADRAQQQAEREAQE